MSNNNDSQEYQELAGISLSLKSEYVGDNSQWKGSPFEWIRQCSPRAKGAIGEKIVSGWLAMHEFNVQRSPDSQADRIIEGLRVEIKYSMLWDNGTYLFEQIRDQNYDFAIFLGVSPFDAHCWVVPKSDLMRLWKSEHRISSQHGGHDGGDTAWVRLSPSGNSAVDDNALAEYGNGLKDALERISALTGYSFAPVSQSVEL